MSGLFQTRRPAPVATSAVQIAQGLGVRVRIGSGAPPRPGWRVKATCLPSGDQTGSRSMPVDGAIQAIGLSSPEKIPMKAWSSRIEENTSLVPSGDQARSLSLPRSKNSFRAFEPSSLAVQTAPSFR